MKSILLVLTVLLSGCVVAPTSITSFDPPDDTAAITAAASSGQIVQLEPQVYVVTGNVPLTTNSGFIGCGRATEIRFIDGGFVMDGETDVTLERLQIAPHADDTQLLPLVKMTGQSYRLTLRDVYFNGNDGTSGTARNGLYVDDGHDIRAFSCDWRSFAGGAAAVEFFRESGASSRSPQFYACRIAGCSRGIVAKATKQLLWVGGLIEGHTQVAITLNGTQMTKFDGVHFENNSTLLTTPGRFHVLVGSPKFTRNTHFDNCYFNGAVDACLNINNADVVWVRGGQYDDAPVFSVGTESNPRDADDGAIEL